MDAGSPGMKILLVEDDVEYAYLLKRMLSLESENKFELVNARLLSEALSLLIENRFDAILLDLSLPDSEGLDTFLNVSARAIKIPIVVLTAMESEALALQAVKEGAQDYLVKIQVNNKVLLRSLRFAFERQQAIAALERLTMIDDLTGLYNRRGFSALAEKYLQLANRNQSSLLLMFADVDRLKSINDQFGHQEGDQALIATGKILRQTCREADIVARISGDEFAVLAMDIAPKNGDVLSARLIHNLNQHNSQSGCPYQLSLSFGFTHFDPQNPSSLEELLSMADNAMYEQKREKRRA